MNSVQAQFPDPKALAGELIRRDWLTPYQANQLLTGKGHELVLGSYILLERLGEGGMGQVFKARHRTLGRIAAIKLIRKERLDNPSAVKRFQREVRSAAALSHPNIVLAYDADEIAGTHLMVMEYIAGAIDLAKLVKKNGPLPVLQACEYIRQTSLGLQHAFERGMVHRDIKPANLLLTDGGRTVKVLDMGLARLDDPTDEDGEKSTTMTQEGAVMGTPDYIAPEQALESHTVDIRADLYSLGCAFYFLLAGRVPFPGGTLLQKLNKHQFEEPLAVEKLRPEVPLEVGKVVRKLMAKKPADRYQTPAEKSSVNSAEPSGIKSMNTQPTTNRGPFRILLPITLAVTVGLLEMISAQAWPEKLPQEPAVGPWGLSSSAGSTRNVTEWFPKMSAAGVTTVRLFPEWRDFEPTKGTWKWDRADALVEAAAKNKIEINGILMGSSPGDKKIHAFPMDNLDGWSNFVSTVVGRYKNRIHCWEVWNEGNGGFNDGKHTTTDYAKLAVATYAAAKKADPHAKIGLTVASFDAPYFNQAILAMAKEGKPASFDYLCIHPYEIADHLGEADGEIPFLWMTRLLRDMLKVSAPERAGAEIWITEVARRVEKRKGHVVTEQDAAKALAKIYTMAIAQGIARTQWFEAQDPVGEDQGFGLLARNGAARAAYGTFKTLTTHLGSTPKYLGWLALGKDGKGYGFVFQGNRAPYLVAWMPAGQSDETFAFASDAKAIDTVGGAVQLRKAGQPFTLTDTPILVMGVPAELLKQAQGNAGKNFPWGGDYSMAKAVHCEPGIADGNRGVFQVQRATTPTVKFADGSTGILSRGDIGQAVSFYVHPSFANFQTKEYFIRVRVRRVAPGNVGMNLQYEVADSQGRTPYKNRGQWFGLTADDDWQTYTWHVTDACFSKMWGYDFSFRPEQSVPFVIGKVEVSTIPFK